MEALLGVIHSAWHLLFALRFFMY